MNFEQYQLKSKEYAIYPRNEGISYCTLGLISEVGEVADKLKKIMRDKKGIISQQDKQEIAKELGDALWYLAQLTTELNLDLDAIASGNLIKLRSRKDRGQLQGSGDNR